MSVLTAGRSHSPFFSADDYKQNLSFLRLAGREVYDQPEPSLSFSWYKTRRPNTLVVLGSDFGHVTAKSAAWQELLGLLFAKFI